MNLSYWYWLLEKEKMMMPTNEEDDEELIKLVKERLANTGPITRVTIDELRDL